MTDQQQRRLFPLPILCFVVVSLACAQLTAGRAPATPVVSTQAPSPVPASPVVTPTVPPTSTAAPATSTASPAPAGGAPCVIVVRTPPPSAPTEISSGTAVPRQVDPHVEACASATKASVGQTITVLGQAVDIGGADYLVQLQDQGAADPATLVEITFENQVRNRTAVSQVLELVTIEANNDKLVITLRAHAAGQTQLTIGAQGEVHLGYPGPATTGSGFSAPISFTITAP